MIKDFPIVQELRNLKTFRSPQQLILIILIFVAVFMTGSMVQSIAMMIGIFPRLIGWTMEQMELNGGEVSSEEVMQFTMQLLEDPSMTAIMLYSTALATAVTLLYCRVLEGRKLRTLGLRAEHGVLHYLVGLAVGFVMFSATIGLSYVMGGVTFEGTGIITGTTMITMIGGWLLQGMSEEVIFRGYFMTTMLRFHKPWVAILVNSIGFAIAHGANNGVTLLALVNLTLYGVVMSLYLLRTGSLWGCCAIHSIWNFVQGNFYGLPVSGINLGDTVFRFQLVDGRDWANGGAFGTEAGIPTTIVLLICTGLLLFVPSRQKTETPAEAA